MKFFKAYWRMFLITFGIGFGGLVCCGIIALALINFLGLESKITQISLFVLVVPALILFLLSLGLGNSAFYKTCAQITNQEEGAKDSDDTPEEDDLNPKTGANHPQE